MLKAADKFGDNREHFLFILFTQAGYDLTRMEHNHHGCSEGLVVQTCQRTTCGTLFRKSLAEEGLLRTLETCLKELSKIFVQTL